ncbi:MAG TPA: cell division protein FtsH, partial [Myxococcales bacterium]|nr:cell division protein FtsH [Myxococcales bacterium]
RTGILKVHTKKTPLGANVDLDVIARGTPGFSGADLENLVNEAALLAARQNKDKIDLAAFEFAKDKVMMGSERRSMIISDKDKKITAWHEAGHALVAMLTPECDPVHKVTIIPRGPALGLTQMLPKEDRLNWNKKAILDRIAMAMGGRIAEELQFDEITSGAKSDIDHATKFARSMVQEWGMSDKLGPLAFGEEEGEVFLGREFASRQRNYSEATAIDIDNEVRLIVTTQYQRAKQILTENKPALDRIAEALLEWETLDGNEIGVLMRGETLVKVKPVPVQARPEVKRPEIKEKSKILDALGGLTAPVPKTEAGKA